ncbi:hypothetical protein NQZ68_034643 [Dissostichus eleginoides]|nr:hypothetical protein NQZ68_034643 [Dissostichus eleginoides]
MAASRLVFFWILIVLRTAAGFLQEEEEGEPGSGVTETDLNETVLCSNDQMKVVIPSIFFLRKDPPVFVGDLHLNDPECRGVEVGEDYVFSIKTNLSDCGTIMTPGSRLLVLDSGFQTPGSRLLVLDSWYQTPGSRLLVLDSWFQTPGANSWFQTPGSRLLVSDQSHIMFTNSIHNNESQVISRNYVNITFSCRYPVRYLVQQPGGGHGVHVHLRGPGGGGGLVVERAWWWRGPGGGEGLVVEGAWWWRGPGGGEGLVVERAWWWRGPGGGGGLVVEGAWTITLNTEDGNFSVSMLLFKDEAFEDRWATVPSLRLEDHVFVKVFMIPAHLMLRMERCWATPSSDPYSNIQYTFIRESCPVLSSVQTLSVLRNGEGPDAAFRLQMFKFVGSSYTNVFLHCNVQICSLSSGQCQPCRPERETPKPPDIPLSEGPNCSSVGEEELIRTRRDVPLSHTVSYGPIRRLLQDGGKPDLSGGLPAVGTLVLGGLLVLVLLLVSGLFGRLWLRSRSFYPIREAQLTLSNIHTLSEVAS